MCSGISLLCFKLVQSSICSRFDLMNPLEFGLIVFGSDGLKHGWSLAPKLDFLFDLKRIELKFKCMIGYLGEIWIERTQELICGHFGLG